MSDDWKIQSVLIEQQYRSREQAEDLATRILEKIEEPGRGGYPETKDIERGDEYYHVEIRQDWRFDKIRTLTDRDEYGRVKAAQSVSKGAGLKVGRVKDT